MKFDHYNIRLLTSADAEAYFKLIDNNRPRLEDYFSGTVSKTKTLNDTKEYLKGVMNQIEAKEYFPFAVEDLNTGEFVGFVDLKRIEWGIPKGEFGCYFDSNYAGKGLAKKAMSAVIDHLFKEYKFNKLYLRTHETNTAARALAESCGFQLEGHIRNDFSSNGKLFDLMYYGLVRE